MMQNISKALLDQLYSKYAEPHRYYHNWAHIEALLSHAKSIRKLLHDVDAVKYAILFHDLIYDPKERDNELKSAEFLLSSNPPISETSLKFSADMIKATAQHRVPDNLSQEQRTDCAHFLDMDLSILGTDVATFDMYDKQIRQEYSHLSDDIYYPGRRAVLQSFLNRKTLYLTSWAQAQFEKSARDNLARALSLLSI